MLYLLDTNICSYILKRRPETVKRRFDEVGPEHLGLSSVVLAELYYGAARHPQGMAIRQEIDDFVSRLTLFPGTKSQRIIMAKFAQPWKKAAPRSGPWT